MIGKIETITTMFAPFDFLNAMVYPSISKPIEEIWDNIVINDVEKAKDRGLYGIYELAKGKSFNEERYGNYEYSAIDQETLSKLLKGENKDKNSTYEIDYEIYKHIHHNYVHLSAHYGGFENDFLTVQTGDHHLLANYVFINEPVEPVIKEDKVIYKREIYVPKG